MDTIMTSNSIALDSLIVSTEAIKPSSPTPSHLKTYNLSFSDQFAPSVFIPIAFVYPYSGPSTNITSHQEKTCRLLKKSLSQTLTNYYPFSGRLVASPDGYYVDCNDEGVEFVEARVNAQLSQVMDLHHKSQDDLFFPTGTVWGATRYNSLVKVRLTYFNCGGLSLAVCLSHKIGDTCTLITFIKHWAAMSHKHYNLDSQQAVEPFPPHIVSSRRTICPEEIMFTRGNKCVSRRFVFPNSKIEQLKVEVGIRSPTRVEVVNSLLYLCAVRAATANRSSFYKVFVLVQSANIRKRLSSPLKETMVGNFSWAIEVPSIFKSRLTLKSLTAQIQNAKSKLADVTISQYKRWQKEALMIVKYVPKLFYEPFVCTSLCGYGIYRVDFGWGNPITVNFPIPDDQYFILMDTPSEDGIQVVVSLKEEDMAKFQADEQLLSFAFAA